MKSLFPAVAIAVGLHVFLLTRGTNFLSRKSPNPPLKRSVTMTLSYVKPERKPVRPVARTVKKALKPLIRRVAPLHPKAKETPRPVIRTRTEAPAKKKSVRKHPLPPLEKRYEKKRSRPVAAGVKPSRDAAPVPPQPAPYEEPVKDEIVKELLSDPAGPLPETAEPDSPEKKTEHSDPAVIKSARPLYKRNPRPSYPRIARRRGYEGIVVLKVLVMKTGRVGDISILRSSGHKRLDKAARGAVRKWRFEPGTRNGVPISMRVKVPIRFELN